MGLGGAEIAGVVVVVVFVAVLVVLCIYCWKPFKRLLCDENLERKSFSKELSVCLCRPFHCLGFSKDGLVASDENANETKVAKTHSGVSPGEDPERKRKEDVCVRKGSVSGSTKCIHYLSAEEFRDASLHSYSLSPDFVPSPWKSLYTTHTETGPKTLTELQVELNLGHFHERYVGDEADEGGFLAAAGGSLRKPKALFEHPPASKQCYDRSACGTNGFYINDPGIAPLCHTFPRSGRTGEDNGLKMQEESCYENVPDMHIRPGENRDNPLQYSHSLRLERRFHKDVSVFGVVEPYYHPAVKESKRIRQAVYSGDHHIGSPWSTNGSFLDYRSQLRHCDRLGRTGFKIAPVHCAVPNYDLKPGQVSEGVQRRDYHSRTFPRITYSDRLKAVQSGHIQSTLPRQLPTFNAHTVNVDTFDTPYISTERYI